jgi:hypothetical protein
MKFQRGDLVKVLCCWFEDAEFKTETLPAIVMEAKDKYWTKVWIPAQNRTMQAFADNLKHYNPKVGESGAKWDKVKP